MAETRRTAACNHAYQLCRDVLDFAERALVPAIVGVHNDSKRPNRKRDRAVECVYTRVLMWLKSVEKLNQTRDMQGVGTAARSIFEHYLDLKWFQSFPEDLDLDRFWAFPEVERYWAAKKAVEHKAASTASQLNDLPYQEFVKRADAGSEPVPAKVARLWGVNNKNQPRWPRDHWTGVRSLRQRAAKLGPEFEDTYVQIYPTLCTLIHPTPTPLVGDFEWMETQVGFGYFHTFRHAWASTQVSIELLGIDVPHLEPFQHQLTKWMEEAAAAHM